MAWLVCDGRVLATLEVATSWRARARGLLGRDGIDGAILLRPAWSVHTVRMRFPIDVAFCDADLRVLKVVTLAPNRATLPVLRGRAVIECEAGMLRRWGVRGGTRLEVRGVEGLGPSRTAVPDDPRRAGHGGPSSRTADTPAPGAAPPRPDPAAR